MIINVEEARIQQRRDTAANWTSGNPTLLAGELGFETDTRKFKLGNGSTAWNSLLYANPLQTMCFIVACSDETTAIATGTDKVKFRMPFAFTVTAVRCSVTSACATGTFTVDIHESGTTILSTKLTLDATEKTSTTASVAAVISDSALADDAEISVDVDDDADGTATGLKVTIIGRPT